MVENTASAISELARHLLVLQNAFVLSHDNLVEQDRLCGQEIETLSNVAQSLHMDVRKVASKLHTMDAEASTANADMR